MDRTNFIEWGWSLQNIQLMVKQPPLINIEGKGKTTIMWNIGACHFSLSTQCEDLDNEPKPHIINWNPSNVGIATCQELQD